MIYDCFTFFNELDLLDMRLNILNDVVDRFVIVEATKTFSGKEKDLIYKANRERFSRFSHKIIYIVPEHFPEFKTPWTYESYQRNCIADGLKDCKPNDTILISDCDEIPNPEVVRKWAGTKGIKILEQYMCYYYINCLDVNYPIWTKGTRMMPYSDFLHGLDGLDVVYNDYNPKEINQGTTANALRMWQYAKRIENGGWHFSYLGGVEAIIAKIKSFSHQEFNNETTTSAEILRQRIANGEDIFQRDDHKYRSVTLDEAYPEYIRTHQNKFAHLIMPQSKDTLFHYRTYHGLVFRIDELCDILRHQQQGRHGFKARYLKLKISVLKRIGSILRCLPLRKN